MTTRESSPDSLGSLLPSDDAAVFRSPTSFAQERLWFLDQFEPDSSLYNLMVTFRVKGTVSLAALQRSIQALVDRHETLRTVFGTEDGRPVQIVLPALRLDMTVDDLSMMAPAEQDAELSRRAQHEATIPFSLTRGPLIRVRFTKLSERDYGIFMSFHHIIFDGWSVGVFFRELNQLYTAYAQGQTLELPELAIQYADFAAWQKEWLQGEALTQEMTFWKEHLAGAPGLLELPSDRPRPAVMSFRGGREPSKFTAEQTNAIEALARRHNVTPFMLLLAAYEVFLARSTGQYDFVVGTPIAGRTRVELEPLIGFFTNTLVLRAHVEGDPTFAELLLRVRDTALNAFVHQNIPFEKLVEELQPERSLSYNPLFQVMFAYQNTPDQDVRLSDLELSEILTKRISAKFDLTLTCMKDEGKIEGSFEYNADIFDVETVKRMCANFVTLVDGIIAAPEQHISRLPIISAPELHRIVREWNANPIRATET